MAPFVVRDAAGHPYDFPFLGGFDVPRPQFVDVDGDGDLDLFVQERSDALIFFENTGTASDPRFAWRTDHWHDLAVGEWSRFYDVDGDGDLDLLAEQPYSYVRYYENTGSASAPRFRQVADSLRDTEGTPIFADRQNIAQVTDIDCDSLPDLFLGRVDGTITRYEATERHPDGAPRFRFVTDRFEGIEIVAQLGSRHGANSMAFVDVDGDGDLDLLWGDFFEAGVLLVRNTGSCSSPALHGAPEPLLLANGDTLRTSGYNVPAVADLWGTGRPDLFLGVLGGAFNPNLTAADNLYRLRPAGGRSYELETRRFLSSIDLGSESQPALVDWDGDGDLDVVVGNKLDPTTLDRGRLYVFRNDGTRSAPALRLSDTLNLAASFNQAPAFGDLDGDGSPELLLGTWNDGVLLYRNRGTRPVPRYAIDSAATLHLSRGSHATPTLGDLDGDGDLDLLLGKSSGEIEYLRNEGTAAAPRFVLASERFGDIDVGRRSRPWLVDLDGDGDLDLLVGGEDGVVWLWRNEGSTREPHFVPDPAVHLVLPPLAAPSAADLDGDGRPELVIGGVAGGLLLYRLPE